MSLRLHYGRPSRAGRIHLLKQIEQDATMQLNDPTLFRQQAMINGRWRDASSGETLAVTNPANGQPLGCVPKMGAGETREAIDAAARAARMARRRQRTLRILRRWFELMMEIRTIWRA
jgi:succinate-semialdehyde dehydrogenase/glutarate-semialdehyde dehydrogenase